MPPEGRPEIRRDFCDLLLRKRRNQGWSQLEVAVQIGVSVKTYGNWENGRTAPMPGPEVRRLAGIYRIPVGEMLYGQKEEGRANHRGPHHPGRP